MLRAHRIAVALGILGLTVSALVLVAEHTLLKPARYSGLERNLTFVAQRLSESLDEKMFERWQDMVAGARRHVLRSRAGEDHEREVVEEIKSRHSRYAWVGFTDEGCVVRVSTEASLNKMNVESRPWCSEARKSPFVGDIHEAVLLKTRLKDIGRIGLLMDIAVPVRSTGNDVTGVLAAHLSADWLIDETDMRLGPITTAVVTSQGQVITAAGLIGSIAGAAYGGLIRTSLQQAQWPDGEFLSLAQPTKGKVDFPGFGWTAVARVPADQVNSVPVTWVALGGLLASLMTAGAGLWLGKAASAKA